MMRIKGGRGPRQLRVLWSAKGTGCRAVDAERVSLTDVHHSLSSPVLPWCLYFTLSDSERFPTEGEPQRLPESSWYFLSVACSVTYQAFSFPYSWLENGLLLSRKHPLCDWTAHHGSGKIKQWGAREHPSAAQFSRTAHRRPAGGRSLSQMLLTPGFWCPYLELSSLIHIYLCYLFWMKSILDEIESQPVLHEWRNTDMEEANYVE